MLRLNPLRPSNVYKTFWTFAAERQRGFFRRAAGSAQPDSDDVILQRYRFTNAYRAADRVSQYLIRNVLYEGEQSHQEIVFRSLLFRTFNKIETWELLKSALGHVSYSNFDQGFCSAVLDQAFSRG